MKISAEELERIKELHKAKDLQEILKEGKNKKDDEGGDQNFISDMVDQQTFSAAQEKRDSIYQKLKYELNKTIQKLRNALRPVNTELRSLDNEVGGLEVNYKKVEKEINQDVDVWDDQAKRIDKQAVETEHQDQEENKSFIHLIKTGLLRPRGKKGKKHHMRQVDLGKAAEQDDNVKPVGFVEKISKLREDRRHIQNDGHVL